MLGKKNDADKVNDALAVVDHQLVLVVFSEPGSFCFFVFDLPYSLTVLYLLSVVQFNKSVVISSRV